MSGAQIGIDPTDVTPANATPQFKLGTVMGLDTVEEGHKEYVYGRANGAVTGRGYVCVEEAGFNFVLASLTSTAPGASGNGSRVGAAQAALADNEYGWFQIYGKGPVRTLASAAKGTRLNSTGTGGALDDDATAGSEAINHIVLLTATGGAAATNEDAMFSYPSVGATL